MKKKNEIVNFTVQKSNAVLQINNSFALSELKIIDTVISKMNNCLLKGMSQRQIEEIYRNNRIVITDEEMKEALGLSRLNKEHLKPRFEKLCKFIDLVPEEFSRAGYQIVIFESIRYFQDDNKKWFFEFTFTNSAMKEIIIPYHTHYLAYKLKNISKLRSKHSYILYNYLEGQRYLGNDVKVSVEFLMRLFNIKEGDSCSEYKTFKRDILTKAINELNEKTDCHLTMDEDTEGYHNVTCVIFHLEPKGKVSVSKPTEQFSVGDCHNTVLDVKHDSGDYSGTIYDCSTAEGQERMQIIFEYREKMFTEFQSFLTDYDILACAHYLHLKYGQYNYFGYDNEIGAFNEILTKIYRTGNIGAIDNVGGYVLECVRNNCKGIVDITCLDKGGKLK